MANLQCLYIVKTKPALTPVLDGGSRRSAIQFDPERGPQYVPFDALGNIPQYGICGRSDNIESQC